MFLNLEHNYVTLCRLEESAWKAVHGCWTARVLNGHINFYTAQDSAPGTLSAQPQSAMLTASTASPQMHLPLQDDTKKPVLPGMALHTLRTEDTPAGPSQAATGSHAVGEEEDEGILGHSPTSSITDMWAGPALSLSLKSAIADRQNHTSSSHVLDTVGNGQTIGRAVPSGPSDSTQDTRSGQSSRNTSASWSTAGKAIHRSDNGSRRHVGSSGERPDSNGSGGHSQIRQSRGGPNLRGDNGLSQQAGQFLATPASGSTKAGSQQAGLSDTTALRGSGGAHSQESGPGPVRHLEIKMVPAGPELVDIEFPLYHKYQVSNHHDDPRKVIIPRPLSVRFPYQCCPAPPPLPSPLAILQTCACSSLTNAVLPLSPPPLMPSCRHVHAVPELLFMMPYSCGKCAFY